MTAAHRVIEARKALQVKLERDVRFGSKADMCVAKRDVRFTPESDIKCDIKECPLWANSGHRESQSMRVMSVSGTLKPSAYKPWQTRCELTFRNGCVASLQ
jgi:hypothetical protein